MPSSYTVYALQTISGPPDLDFTDTARTFMTATLIRAAGGNSIDSQITDNSSNAVENNAIHDEFVKVSGVIQQLSAATIENHPNMSGTMRIDNSNIANAGSITYDRDIIYTRISGSPYLILRRSVVSGQTRDTRFIPIRKITFCFK